MQNVVNVLHIERNSQRQDSLAPSPAGANKYFLNGRYLFEFIEDVIETEKTAISNKIFKFFEFLMIFLGYLPNKIRT